MDGVCVLCRAGSFGLIPIARVFLGFELLLQMTGVALSTSVCVCVCVYNSEPCPTCIFQSLVCLHLFYGHTPCLYLYPDEFNFSMFGSHT